MELVMLSFFSFGRGRIWYSERVARTEQRKQTFGKLLVLTEFYSSDRNHIFVHIFVQSDCYCRNSILWIP